MAPFDDNPLLSHLLERYADRLTVVVPIGELRRSGAAVGYPLSWERSAEEVDATVRAHPLGAAAHVVVQLELSGALLVEHDGDTTLVFDPARARGRVDGAAAGDDAGLPSLLRRSPRAAPGPRAGLQRCGSRAPRRAGDACAAERGPDRASARRTRARLPDGRRRQGTVGGSCRDPRHPAPACRRLDLHHRRHDRCRGDDGRRHEAGPGRTPKPAAGGAGREGRALVVGGPPRDRDPARRGTRHRRVRQPVPQRRARCSAPCPWPCSVPPAQASPSP